MAPASSWAIPSSTCAANGPAEGPHLGPVTLCGCWRRLSDPGLLRFWVFQHQRVAGRTGVWTIASGVPAGEEDCGDGESMSHGGSPRTAWLSTSRPDLRDFDLIVPCVSRTGRSLRSSLRHCLTMISARPTMENAIHSTARNFGRISSARFWSRATLWIDVLAANVGRS